MNFELLRKLINELNVSNSTLDKTRVLSKEEYNDPFIKGVLKATYNPFKQYYVTPANLQKRSDLVSLFSEYPDLFELLNALSSRKITGHEAISEVNSFLKSNKEYADIILDIFDRNLKTRVSEKIINKIFPNLIPTFDVALANKFDDKQSSKISFTRDAWYASRKLDGLRCIVLIDEGGVVKIYSRSGKEFLTLDVLKKEIESFGLTNIVFDGEVCIVDEDGNENFQAILKDYNRKNYTIPNPRYKIFDVIDLDDFFNKTGTMLFSQRNIVLNKLLKDYNGNVLDVVPQWRITSGEHLIELTNKAKEDGWEGIMIRKDVVYEGKRSNNMLKCKAFFDAEYIVTGIETGPFRVIVNGVEVTEDVVRNVSIEHKGFKVDVGSGFSIEQRRHYKEHPEDIIGKQITVQYFEETANQRGEISLRFPVVKAVYENMRDV